MAKLNEIIYDVRERINEFADDTEIDNSYIVYQYGLKRSKYLRQELNNYNRRIDVSIQQTFCMGLEIVDQDDCTDGDCLKLLRTKRPIPTALEMHTKPAILRVKPTSKIGIPFNFIPKEKIPYIEGAQFSRGMYAFLDEDGYIYVYSLSDAYKLLECITITGVFSNPLELQSYTDCCNCEPSESPCYDPNENEYPLQPHFIDIISREIVNDLLIKRQLPEDTENNTTNDKQ